MRVSGGVLLGSTIALFGLFSLTSAPSAQAQGGGSIQCGSSNGKFSVCRVPWQNARLVQQNSKSACVRDQSWGVDQRGVWVDHGCRGVFAEQRGYGGSHGGGGWRPGPGWNRSIRLECSSQDNRYQLCQVDLGRQGRARLETQMSKNRCTEGYSWGSNRAGVWVNHGCRGQFVVDRRW
jgi:hypothetical protein